jgi:TrmH family RNA methyltransferase
LQKISLQQSPNQVLAVCRFLPPKKEINSKGKFFFYLDDIRDPGNLGTIVRLASWFGMPALFCSPTTCDLYNPKVIQSTMGGFLRVNVIYEELTEVIKQQGFTRVYGALLEGDNIFKSDLGYGLIVIGNEANGISEKNLPLLTHRITIPSAQKSGTESLNAAIASSIIAAEFFRQGLR